VAARRWFLTRRCKTAGLCVGDDCAEDHHDIEVMDEAGKVLARKRLPEGVAGIGQLHELIGRFLPADGDAEVQVGIETDRGPWVAALIARATRCSRPVPEGRWPSGTGAGPELSPLIRPPSCPAGQTGGPKVEQDGRTRQYRRV